MLTLACATRLTFVWQLKMIHSSEMRQSTRVETVLPYSHTHCEEFTRYFGTKLQSLDAEISLQHNRITNPSDRAYIEDFYWSLSSRYTVRRSVIGSYYNHVFISQVWGYLSAECCFVNYRPLLAIMLHELENGTWKENSRETICKKCGENLMLSRS